MYYNIILHLYTLCQVRVVVFYIVSMFSLLVKKKKPQSLILQDCGLWLKSLVRVSADDPRTLGNILLLKGFACL
jgi:hypothetical protein